MFTTFLLISLRIICYVIPVIFLISLFKPEKFNIRTNKNINGKYSQKKYYLVMGGVWIVFLIVGIIVADNYYDSERLASTADQEALPAAIESQYNDEQMSNEIASVEPQIPTEEESTTALDVSGDIEEGTFGITLDEFDKNFEDLSKKMGLYDASEGKTDPYSITKGEFDDTFTEKYTENEAMIGVLSKKGNIKELTFIKDKALERGDDINVLLAGLGSAVVGLDPQTDFYRNQEIFLSQIQNTKDQFTAEGNGEQSGSIGDVAYIIKISEETATQVTLLPYQ